MASDTFMCYLCSLWYISCFKELSLCIKFLFDFFTLTDGDTYIHLSRITVITLIIIFIIHPRAVIFVFRFGEPAIEDLPPCVMYGLNILFFIDQRRGKYGI